jgi:hypothetical protein
MFLVRFRLDGTCGLVARGRKVSLDSTEELFVLDKALGNLRGDLRGRLVVICTKGLALKWAA